MGNSENTTKRVNIIDINDEPYILFGINGTRPKQKAKWKKGGKLEQDQQRTAGICAQHPLIMLANAESLPDFLMALDHAYSLEKYRHLPFMQPCFIKGGNALGQIQPKPYTDATAALEIIGIPPTKHPLLETKAALETWRPESTDARTWQTEWTKADESRAFEPGEVIALADAYQATREAAAFAKMLAIYAKALHSSIDFESDTLGKVLATLSRRGDIAKGKKGWGGFYCLNKFYKSIPGFPANSVANLRDSSFTPAEILTLVFSSMRNAATRQELAFDKDSGKPEWVTVPNCLLVALWDFLGSGLAKPKGAGTVALCPYCGRFFVQTKADMTYCKDGCRVQANRKRLAKSANPPE